MKPGDFVYIESKPDNGYEYLFTFGVVSDETNGEVHAWTSYYDWSECYTHCTNLFNVKVLPKSKLLKLVDIPKRTSLEFP